MLLAWGTPLVIAAYGYPLQPPAHTLTVVIISAGCTLLLLSLLRAHRGQMPPADAPSAGRNRNHAAERTSAKPVPTSRRIISPILIQSAWTSCLGLSGLVLLRHGYPHATEAVLWTFLGSVSLASVIAAQRWTRSLWMWRCLPLTTGRATLSIEAAQLFPLVLTVSAAWLLGRLTPSIAVPMPAWLPAATIALVSLANTQARLTTRRNHEPYRFRYWLASSTALAYLSVLLAGSSPGR